LLRVAIGGLAAWGSAGALVLFGLGGTLFGLNWPAVVGSLAYGFVLVGTVGLLIRRKWRRRILVVSLLVGASVLAWQCLVARSGRPASFLPPALFCLMAASLFHGSVVKSMIGSRLQSSDESMR
jgi:hypothetical protein